MALLLVLFVLVLVQLILPQRWAFLPLVIAACHTGTLEIAGNFTVTRLVIVIGLARAGLTGNFRWERSNALDVSMLLMSIVAILSSLGHKADNPFIYRAGLVFNIFGAYLYARSYIFSFDALQDLAKALVIVLIPLAILMNLESKTGRNYYSPLGARSEQAAQRDGRMRAAGPFGTYILGGTAGAVCAPLLLPLWRKNRWWVIAGLGSCGAIVISSASSGPIGSVLVWASAIALWPYRMNLKKIRWLAISTLVLLHFVKERPVWYLMALIDFVGGSTGWYRARMIDEGLIRLDEWWLWGTDVTRHWTGQGISGNRNHIDITNYYLHLGVIGGLPLVLCLFYVLFRAFQALGNRMAEMRQATNANEFVLWCCGAALFSHAVTFLTISYFDQMFVLFYMLVGVIGSLAINNEANMEEEALPVKSSDSLGNLSVGEPTL